MTKKTIFFDLDNTLYFAPSICDDLFAPLYQLIQNSNDHHSHFDSIKQDMMRKPFHWVAEKHGFAETLTQQGIQLLGTTTYNKPIEPFADYAEIKNLPQTKYLVTSGFERLQRSKIKCLNIENDFKEIYIVNLENNTKTNVFASIIKNNHYRISDVLVVGDDMHSEIAAAKELGIDAVLYDKLNIYPDENSLPRITDYKELKLFL